MKKTLLVMFALLAALTTLLLIAQEKEMSAEEEKLVAALNPSDDEVWQWMIGEWEGGSESAMGKSEDWMKFEWDLNSQFLTSEVRSTAAELNPEMVSKIAAEQGKTEAEIQKMMSAPYWAKGYATFDYQSGEIVSYWFDSHRSIYKGSETRSGNTITMHMKQLNGMITVERTAEKVSNDKMVGTFRSTLPDGQVIEGGFEATRKLSQ